MILLDVDGVLTDGRITYVGAGREAKSFDVRDGVGLWLARRAGLRTGIISGRSGAAVLRRAAELHMDEVHLEVRDKLAAYRQILRRGHLRDAQICYVGDDVVDLPLLARVGLGVAVADAHPEVLRRTAFVTEARGGRGAVREVVDAILMAQGKRDEVLGWFDPGRAAGRGRRPAGARRSRG
ncbi:MAG: KdsC family phosphatase [Acidobacteriota bacterium]